MYMLVRLSSQKAWYFYNYHQRGEREERRKKGRDIFCSFLNTNEMQSWGLGSRIGGEGVCNSVITVCRETRGPR